MKIKISPLFLLIIAIFILSDSSLFIIPIILSASLHEVGHILAIYLCNGKISKLHVMPFGAQITLKNKGSISYKKEMIISSAGIVVNLAIFIISLIIYTKIKAPIVSFTASCNLALFFMNLIPIFPLDGGRMLQSFLLCKLDLVKALLISEVVSLIFLVLLIIFGMYIFIETGYNFSLLLIGVYLLIAYIVKNLVKIC